MAEHQGGSSETAMWASPSAPRVRSRPSNLHTTLRASPSFPLSHRGASTPVRSSVERPKRRSTVQSRTTQATQTETEDVGECTHLENFGFVKNMTVETVNFLISVLEDRKQELLVADEEKEAHVNATFAGEDEEVRRVIGAVENFDERTRASNLQSVLKSASLGLDSNSSEANVVGLGRSQSYESLVRLEGMLEARHRELMNDGLLETQDRHVVYPSDDR